MASGPKGETTDMAAVPEAARRVRAEACRELAGIYPPNRPDLASALEQVLDVVERYLTESDATTVRSRRADTAKSVLHHASELRRRLGRLDPMLFVEASGPPPGEGVAVPAKAVRLAAHLEFLTGLDRTEAALRHLSKNLLPKRRDQPETSDAILFGIEALAALWQQSRGVPPTSSQKVGAFGAMVLDVFRLLGGKVPEAAAKTALRRVIAGRRRAEQTEALEAV
jgi:hypothetical protein